MKTPDFEDAIREEPENIDLRLIAADWYEERSDPRAEFIRVQLALRNLPPQHEWRAEMLSRERLLLAENHKRWNAPVHQLINTSSLKNRTHRRRGALRGWTYQRGYIEQLSVDARTWLLQRDMLLQIGPITSLKLWNASERHLMSVVDSPEFSRFSGLDLQHNHLGDVAVSQLLSSIDVSRLRFLNLTGNDLTEATVSLLLRSSLTNMTRLVLSQNSIPQAQLLGLHERFGDCVQHENGNPVYMWKQETPSAPDDEELNYVSYSDDVLYEDGREEREYEPDSVDRFNGVEALEDEPPPQRPDDYASDEDDPVGWADDREEPDWGSEDDVW